jgi:putative sterol carrier protein
MRNVMKAWTLFLNKNETKSVEETFFFDFSDNKEESCAFEIVNGKCNYIDGEPENFTVKITIDSKYWIAILARELKIKDALADGKIAIDGNDEAAEKFVKYFSGDTDGSRVKIENYSVTENEKEIQEGRWSKPQKVLGLIGTPRKEGGMTSYLFKLFSEGLDECEVDTVYVADLKNKPCRGCFTCWHGKDKKCVHNDDTNKLIHELHNYDLLVIAAPVYLDGLPGMLKNLLDRLLCIIDPEFILIDGHCRHPSRYPKMPHLVLISTCGYAEMDNFHPMVEHVKEICKNAHMTYLGEILIPTGWLLSISNLQPFFKDTIEAIKQAGKEIITKGKISEKLTKQITKQPLTTGQILSLHNRNSMKE